MDAGSGSPGAHDAYRLLEPAVDGILAQSEEASAAFRAMTERGLTEEEAREQVARVLLAVMYHVGKESSLVREAGGGAALRRRAYRRLARGETAGEIFGEGDEPEERETPE